MDSPSDSTQNQTEDLYISEQTDADDSTNPIDSINWTASEFLHHQKSASWYLALIGIMVLIGAIAYLITRDYFAPIAVIVLGALLLVSAVRKPRTQSYSVDEYGVVIGDKEFSYNDFQSFSVIREDNIESIALYPHKRFMPIITLYFAPEDGDKIFDMIGKFLPFENREKDVLDRFLHKIKF